MEDKNAQARCRKRVGFRVAFSAMLLAARAMAFALAGCAATADSNSAASASSSSEPSSSSDAQSGTDNAAVPTDQSTTPEQENEEGQTMNITVTIGSHVVNATLYDNDAARALYASLPQTFPMMNLYGREMCYRMGSGSLPTNDAATTGYEVGDISYWPPAGSLVILYIQNGEVFEQQPIGHTDDDLSFLEGAADTDVAFAKA